MTGFSQVRKAWNIAYTHLFQKIGVRRNYILDQENTISPSVGVADGARNDLSYNKELALFNRSDLRPRLKALSGYKTSPRALWTGKWAPVP